MKAILLTAAFVVSGPVIPLVVNSDFGPNAVEIFRLEPGGCLRGPLAFRSVDGRATFKLGPGVYYPSGCEKDGTR